MSEIKYEKDIPQINLYKYGDIVQKYINSINNTYQDLNICNYVIMPNHIHFIVEIIEEDINGSSGTPTPTNAKIPFIISTFKRLTNKESKIKLWQRNYYEHIIRNEKEYLRTLEYIEYNPLRWNKDIYFVE